MYITLLIIISLVSLFSIGEKIGNFLVHNKKYISGFLYFLSILSFLYLGDTSNHVIHETGEKSYDLLMLILFLPILSKVFDFSLAKKFMIFRKELGILMGVLAFIHSLQYFIGDISYQFWEMGFWIFNGTFTYISYGFIALIITIVLTITSNNYSLKHLGKYWKILHRTVYILLFFAVLHVLFFIYGTHDFVGKGLKYGIPLIIYIVGKILEWKNIKLRNKKHI